MTSTRRAKTQAFKKRSGKCHIVIRRVVTLSRVDLAETSLAPLERVTDQSEGRFSVRLLAHDHLEGDHQAFIADVATLAARTRALLGWRNHSESIAQKFLRRQM